MYFCVLLFSKYLSYSVYCLHLHPLFYYISVNRRKQYVTHRENWVDDQGGEWGYIFIEWMDKGKIFMTGRVKLTLWHLFT